MSGFADLGNMNEDDRVRTIADTTRKCRPGFTIAVATDDIPGKPERYKQRILDAAPHLEFVDMLKGPVKDVVTLRFRRK